jgi:hypothetical protein
MGPKTNVFLFLISVSCCLMVTDAAAGMKNIRQAEACTLLSSIGLPTSSWQTYYDNECGCSSRQLSIGSGNPYKNLISYYVEGSGHTVNKIRLIVNVLNTDESTIALAQFQKTALFLIRQLTPMSVPENFSRAIANGTNQTFLADGFLFEVARKEWKMNTDLGAYQCYEIKLVIR